jgi:hypothetical protein
MTNGKESLVKELLSNNNTTVIIIILSRISKIVFILLNDGIT